MRRLPIATVLLVLLAASLLSPHSSRAQGGQRCFQAPGITDCIEGRFRQYWEQNGELAVFGYPKSPAADEMNRDTGRSYLTQWYERNRGASKSCQKG